MNQNLRDPGAQECGKAQRKIRSAQEERTMENSWHYHSFNEEMQRRFGGKVYKLSLSSGCSCPNRDGSIGRGGCIFCSAGGSGEFAAPAALPLAAQLAAAKALVREKKSKNFAGYLAYFQSYTNTYGSVERLRPLFEEALAQPEVLGLSVGTRPDCLPPDIVEMLAACGRKKPVFVELGLQTMHEDTAGCIRRGYALPVFEDAFRRLKRAGLAVVVHVIIGLPGEDAARTEETVRYLAGLTENGQHIDGIKLQLLHILKGTDLAVHWARQQAGEPSPFPQIPVYGLAEYVELLGRLIEILPEEITIHRLTGDAPKRLLIAPAWTADKKRVLNFINTYFNKQEIRQGNRDKSQALNETYT